MGNEGDGKERQRIGLRLNLFVQCSKEIVMQKAEIDKVIFRSCCPTKGVAGVAGFCMAILTKFLKKCYE